jgi:protocatechuate 3,4-dioxygenase beta subunit
MVIRRFSSDCDDDQVGRVLTRREILRLFGGAGAAVLAGATEVVAAATAATGNTDTDTNPAMNRSGPADLSAPSRCVVIPQQTEGPFFIDERLNRSDIRIDPTDGSVKPGVPFQLAFRVSTVDRGRCAVLPGVMVDVWHCDALGHYSDEPANGTTGKKFLRGHQITDANGIAQFTTIYPGWYQGRAVHIHFKLRPASASGRSCEFTSQLYFDDSISDDVFAREPYAAKGPSPLKNARDRIYRDGGDQLLLALAKSGDGYAGTCDIGLPG